MTRLLAPALSVIASALLVACAGGSSSNPTAQPSGAASPAVAGSPTAQPTAAPGEAPMPKHLTFAPGETIAADGKAGIFFLDPYTGAAEAWVVPAAAGPNGYTHGTFTIGGISDDGSKLVYRCEDDTGNQGLCGDHASPHDWYLFDTKTGARIYLTAFSGPFLTISPDGGTLFGSSGDAFAFAPTTRPSQLRTVDLHLTPPSSTMPVVSWSPDSSRIVVSTTGSPNVDSYLVRVDDTSLTKLPGAGGATWSHDSSRLVLGLEVDYWKATGDAIMLDRDGATMWSKRLAGYVQEWSVDDALLLVDAIDVPRDAAGNGPTWRVDVLNASTGETSIRVPGAFCPDGWLGDGHRFLTYSYGSDNATVIDADAGGMKSLATGPYGGLTVVPFDANFIIWTTGSVDSNVTSFYRLSRETGTEDLIAKTTVNPAWDPAHQPRYAGKRIVFAPLHLGHGGCGESGPAGTPPALAINEPPFADDAPVARGP